MEESRLSANRWLAGAGLGLGIGAVGIPRIVVGVALGAIAPSLVAAAPAFGAQLTDWSFNPATQELRVQVPGGTSPNYFILAQPPRIVLDLPNTQVGNVPEVQTYQGAVRQIRVGQFQPSLTRIVIELAPDVVFTSEQVQLQPTANNSQGEQWVLRPLLVGAPTSSPVAAEPPAPASEPSPPADDPPAAAPEPTAEPVDEPIGEPPVEAATPDIASDAQSTDQAGLPPLEPGALEIPVDIPPALPSDEPAAENTAAEEPADADESAPVVAAADGSGAANSEGETADAPVAEEESGGQESGVGSQESGGQELEGEEPEVEVGDGGDRPTDSTVSVPPAAPEPSPEEPPEEPPETAVVAAPEPSPPLPPPVIEPEAEPEIEVDAETLSFLPPATLAADRPVTVEVPSLETAIAASVTSTSQVAVQVPVIEFGQPLIGLASLPASAPGPAPDIVVASRRNTLIPEGTVLSLRYPREEALRLNTGTSRQDVLVLTRTVRDRDGDVIVPAGTRIIGRFEATAAGIQFISQAIALPEENVPTEGQSVEPMATVQPNQQIDLRLTESVRSPR